MGEGTVFIANRGEVAVRVLRAARDLGLRTAVGYAPADRDGLAARWADVAVPLPGDGAASYLDAEALVAAAERSGADLVHPGYGFLSEDAAFARRCVEAGLRPVGPGAEVLERLGDKIAARQIAVGCGVPVARATDGPTDAQGARGFLTGLADGAGLLVKPLAGGGGRGMAAVRDPGELEETMERCAAEARATSGDDRLFVEELLPSVRHIEIQIVGDPTGLVIDLGERDCSLQRRRQKIVEVAPAPGLDQGLREELARAARRIAAEVGYTSLGTVEFLVPTDPRGDDPPFVFIEVNPRLQVEHTVTEEVTGVDLVALQLQLAVGATLAELDLAEAPPPVGYAIQARVNAETISSDGAVGAATGELQVFEPPTGPGLRVDTAAEVGHRVTAAFDPLLAKVVAHASDEDPTMVLRRARRALDELRIEGVATNVGLLRRLLARRELAEGAVTTRFVDEHLAELLPADEQGPGRSTGHAVGPVVAPTSGTVVEIRVAEGEEVSAEQTVAVVEAMKMQHPVVAGFDGRVSAVHARVGQTVEVGAPLARVVEGEVEARAEAAAEEVDLDHIRPDLREVLDRQAATRDEERPEAVARRREQGRRTARENIADLCDPDTFQEYGSLVIAAQRQRRSEEELIERTPADGLITGIGRVNGDRFDDDRSRCAVLAYDYTVLAGTQGMMNHLKKDRLLEIIAELRLPTVLFAEGGGGRPGDTDIAVVSGLHTRAFELFAGLSGRVPTVGIVAGYCFAGNAALLGCCDVIIAAEDASIGMGGPAMIEGGGLGTHRPEEIGPVSVQGPNGVVDVVVADEAEGVDVAKRYLAYVQGPVDDRGCEDQRHLRHLVPEDRRRVYDIRRVIEVLCDTGSVLELRREFGRAMITAFARIEGRPLGLIANVPAHLGGAIDSDAADKAARFMRLCESYGLPIVSLCDTPGFMVGPEAERTAQVRHFARMFVAGAGLGVPFITVVLRKGYGLGAQAMAAGSFHAPLATVSWPTGEFGGMNLEGAVRLGFRRELEAIEDPDQRQERYEQMVELAYAYGRAVNTAAHFELDDVIDPAETRARILGTLRAAPPVPSRPRDHRSHLDTW